MHVRASGRGEVDGETQGDLLARFGRLPGDARLEDTYGASNTKYKTVVELGAAMAAGEADFSDCKGLKPVLRLHPPKRGYEGVKRSFVKGGALGYRKDAINKLARRMLDASE